MGWKISFITYDLHREPVKGDVETEYEEKFSRKGNLVCRLVATRPIRCRMYRTLYGGLLRLPACL